MLDDGREVAAAGACYLPPVSPSKIIAVHITDLFQEEYPYRKLLTRLNEIHYTGFCLAVIPASSDPVRVMKYSRALWLAYQGLL